MLECDLSSGDAGECICTRLKLVARAALELRGEEVEPPSDEDSCSDILRLFGMSLVCTPRMGCENPKDFWPRASDRAANVAAFWVEVSLASPALFFRELLICDTFFRKLLVRT